MKELAAILCYWPGAPPLTGGEGKTWRPVLLLAVASSPQANFTEAAHTRNIEVGALIRCERFAAQLIGHFERLVDAALLKAVDFL